MYQSNAKKMMLVLVIVLANFGFLSSTQVFAKSPHAVGVVAKPKTIQVSTKIAPKRFVERVGSTTVIRSQVPDSLAYAKTRTNTSPASYQPVVQPSRIKGYKSIGDFVSTMLDFQ